MANLPFLCLSRTLGVQDVDTWLLTKSTKGLTSHHMIFTVTSQSNYILIHVLTSHAEFCFPLYLVSYFPCTKEPVKKK